MECCDTKKHEELFNVRTNRHDNCIIGTILVLNPIMKLAGGDIYRPEYSRVAAFSIRHCFSIRQLITFSNVYKPCFFVG